MDAQELRAYIESRAVLIKGKSSSPQVDTWAQEIITVSPEIETLPPTINERRKAERRSGKDTPGQSRRKGDRRRESSVIPPDPEPPDPAPGVEYLFKASNGVVEVGSVVDAAAGAADIKPTWTTTNPYPGDTHSLEFTFGGNPDLADDAWSEWRVKLAQPASDIHFKWFQYFPGVNDTGLGTAPYSHRDAAGADNNKLLRAWCGDTSDGAHGYKKYHQKCGFSTNPTSSAGSVIVPEYGTMKADGSVTGVGQFGLPGTGAVITDATEGKWLTFHARLKIASSETANDGILWLELQGNVILNHLAVPLWSTFATAKRAFEFAYFLGWSNSGFTQTTKIWIARPAIATAWIP